MTQTPPKDTVGYPYDWVHTNTVKAHPYDWVDPYDSVDFTDMAPGTWIVTSEGYPRELIQEAAANPWTNGRYAIAALVWGTIMLVVLGIGAGP